MKRSVFFHYNNKILHCVILKLRPEEVHIASILEKNLAEYTKLQESRQNLLSASSLYGNMETANTVQCPICMKYFSSENIENHAAACYGQAEKTTTQSENESENR